MIKMLIVDDEAIVRKGIRGSIDWNKYNIDMIDEAPNGQAALEKIEKNQPDIVLTDIRMPVMDGLELSKKIKEQNPQIKIVILSGYEDFQYARKAIQIGVNEYLLKPIGDEVLIELVLRLKEQIEKETAEREKNLQSKVLLNQNLLYIKENLMKKIIQGDFYDKHMIFQEAKKVSCDLKGDSYSVFVLQIDELWKCFESMEEKERKILEYSVYNVAEETFFEQAKGMIAFGETVTLIGIIAGEQEKFQEYQNQLIKIQQNINQYLGLSVSIGVGSCYQDVLQVPRSFQEAVSALEKRFYQGKGCLNYYETGEQTEKNRIYDISITEEKEIDHMFRKLDPEELRKRMDQLFGDFQEHRVGEAIVKSISGRLATNILACAKEMGVHREDWQGVIADVYATMDKFETVTSVKDWLVNTCISLMDEIAHNKKRKYTSIIRSAIKFMEENYEKNITLADISEKTFVSPNYFCSVFKDEVGINFVDWLNQFRIEKAALLLKNTNLKIYEIAERVGFTDYKYFCYVFKKMKKCTPKQYRDY